MRWQRLREHLLLVGRQAARYARLAAPHDPEFVRAARRAGLLHDLGKYGDAFQHMLREAEAGRPKPKAPHAVFGAGALGDESWDQALAVLGHHAGLHARSNLENKVLDEHERLARELLGRARGDVTPGPRRKCFRLIGLPAPLVPGGRHADPWRMELRQRMLFSCLVDADRSDSARFDTGENPQAPSLDAASLLPRLRGFIAGKAATCPPGTVKECRATVLKACLEAAGRPERLLTLPVPTGGGKTLSAMAFALRRAELRPDEVRRVIVVEPYLSIIEQNAAEYRKALGEDAVLEHHSGDFAGLSPRERSQPDSQGDPKKMPFTENEGDSAYRPDEEDEDANLGASFRRLALGRENWDAPVIVTTSVRFFETIFSNRPSDLRRLHNIARSVVILDEVQTLPPRLLAPLLSVMEGLSQDWGVHFVFSTATQPAFERHASATDDDRRWPPGTLTPIVPDALQERLVRDLRRVAEPAWPRKGETWSLERQAAAVLAEPRVLCILNTKRQVRELFERLRGKADGHLIHLSTRLCAAHRLHIIRRIRQILESTSEPCRVISSQLVEAGVDLDFPAVLRALGPLDAIVQAAGRCDRGGRLTQLRGEPAGRLTVFEPEDGRSPYPGPTSITRSLSSKTGMSIHNPKVMTNYFNQLYEGELDGPNIQGLRRNFDFPAVNEAFALIDDRTRAVLVPYGEGADIIKRLMDGKLPPRHLRDLLRRAQRYQVGLYPGEFEKAKGEGTIYAIDREERLWACRPSCYDRKLGLVLEQPSAGDYMA